MTYNYIKCDGDGTHPPIQYERGLGVNLCPLCNAVNADDHIQLEEELRIAEETLEDLRNNLDHLESMTFDDVDELLEEIAKITMESRCFS